MNSQNLFRRCTVLVTVVTLFAASVVHAQWVKTTGPDSVRSLASDVAVIGDVLVQGILAGGVNGASGSENDGTHWF